MMNIKMSYKAGNIPVIYESTDAEITLRDKWPSYVSCRPMVGDIVESITGRQLSVKAVVHTIDGNSAALKIILGKNTGGQHAESGGSAVTSW